MAKPKQSLAITVLLLLLVASVVSLVLGMCERRPPPDYHVQSALGRGVAQEVSKMIGNKGDVVIITIRSDEYDVVIAEIEKTFKEQGEARVSAVETLDNKLVFVRDPSQRGVPASEFTAIAQKHSRAAAIISVVGRPVLGGDEMNALKEKLPKVIVIAAQANGIPELLEGGIVQMAAVSLASVAHPPAGGPPTAESMGGIPGTTYKVFTADSDLSLLRNAPMPPSLPARKD